MSKPGMGRAAINGKKAFNASPARSAFGSFSASSSSLSYLSEPPNFSAISDANVVVSLKNLLKKDSTTKSKALEDLVSYTQAHPSDQDGGVEDAILESWVQLYPRISIDNSRRVRELSHVFQLELMKSGRKRMERRIPRIVGTWLVGTFDKDRVVSRAAGDGLSAFLTTDEKTVQFWRKCEAQILEYACGAVRETPDSLSDERSTTREDAEAKYYRVVGGGLSLVLNLLPKIDVRASQDQLARFFDIDVVWSLSAVQDPFVRKTLYQLAQLCLRDLPDLVSSHLPRIGRAFISDALKVKQTGSATDLVTVLAILTKQHPEVWGSKKSPLSRLQCFVEKGSQGCSRAFWQELEQLLVALPQKSVSPEVATEFLVALRDGISNREEPRASAPYAWACYLHGCRHLLDLLDPEDARPSFLASSFYPLTEQYLFPSPEMTSWSGGNQPEMLSRAWRDFGSYSDVPVQQSISSEWERLSRSLLSEMSSSLPETSKEFQKSQQAVADQGKRWFAVTSAITTHRGRPDATLPQPLSHSFESTISTASSRIIDGAVDLLNRRNFKPFGAASLLQSALSTCPSLFKTDSTALLSLFPTNQPEELRTLLSSPSAPFLLSSVTLIGAIPEQKSLYVAVWNSLVQILLQADLRESTDALSLLVSTESAKPLAQSHQALQDALSQCCLQTAKGETDSWALFDNVLTAGVIDHSRLSSLATKLTQLLGSSHYPQEAIIRSIELLVQRVPSLLSENSTLQVDLVAKLLSLTEISSGDVARKAASLRSLMNRHVDGQQPIVTIIQDNLDTALDNALDIDTLVQQTTSLFSSGDVSVEQLFPNTNIWMEQLSLILQDPPDISLSLTSSLSGAYFLVKGAHSATRSESRRDRKGRSIPVRMAMYTSKVLASGVDLSALDPKFRVELLYLLYLAVELASDQITLAKNGQLWQTVSDDGSAVEAEEFVSSTRKLLQKLVADPNHWGGSSAEEAGLVDDLIELMLRGTSDLTPLALYSAKALSDLLQSLSEIRRFLATAEERFVKLGVTKAAPTTVLGAIALITGFGESLASSKVVTRLCNGLVSDITGAFPTSQTTLMAMVLLNTCLSVYELGELPVENRRQIFAVRQITTWMDTPDEVDNRLATEVCRALYRLLPNIKTVYGPYWEQTVEYCISLWNRASHDPLDARLPYLQSSFKLFSELVSMADANDDLEDALSTHAEEKSLALIEVLKIPQDTSTRPSQIVDALLSRMTGKIPLDHIKDLSDLYGLVASESREIQTAAFNLLRRALPASQEQLSLDVLLDNQNAQLPDELLSLLLDAPTLENYPDDLLAKFPTAIRSYLLTWHLIFEAYRAASFKVRSDYTEQLKRTNSLGPLLEFAFDVLGHSAAHALSLDKERFTAHHICNYDIRAADAEPEERSMQWLLIHLFYLTLKYVPGLFKAWFRDCRSKQTRIAVEAWTAKYFSPLIISETLDDVSDWANKQEPQDSDDRELLVKVNKTAKEVVAGYEVDELQAAIAIRVPPGYPLQAVNVVGVNRVAVNEKKWQSWVMATQGVITFSNGNIIDGLTAFRRNVVGALKGQSECAICYSVISADKKMPDKKCSTCKNLFHRTCLYKWFQTSNQNTCPLCRNPIDYLGADTKSRRGGNA